MDAETEKLNAKLRDRKPEVSNGVREIGSEIIALADADTLELARARAVEQEVMDLLAEPASRK